MRIPVGQGPLRLVSSRFGGWKVEQDSSSTVENKCGVEAPGHGTEASRSVPVLRKTDRADGCMEE